ncbi:SETMAR [Cordylochernes scorpioides]|uniref:SETMAR n=1 Tax=Cordylochernes scorpioides TaxID=51811 RepID=A0ABY6LH38_9ARAC|nr:SETMAR [Cordylochernes scorpioides]
MSTFLPTKHNLREALLFCFNLKKSATDGHRLLCEAYGKHALSIKSCEYWFWRFKSGDFDTRDKERGGRPIKFEDAELEALLDEDSSQTQEELAETLGVTQQAISNRLKVMGMVQKQGIWVPYELKPGNIERRICTVFLHRIVTGDEKWIHYDNPKRRKSSVKPGHASTSTAKPNIHGKKLMLCIWWDQLGVIYYELLQPNETITGERYQQQLMRLSQALKIKRPLYTKRHDKVIYQHDNARPHVAKVVKETLEALQWDVLPHPLYSPDIAPSDYHMFRSMTHGLAEQHFTSYEEAKNWVNVWIASKDEEFFRHGIRMLPERWKKVLIQAKGDNGDIIVGGDSDTKKRREILARRPSYRKILNDLSEPGLTAELKEDTTSNEASSQESDSGAIIVGGQYHGGLLKEKGQDLDKGSDWSNTAEAEKRERKRRKRHRFDAPAQHTDNLEVMVPALQLGSQDGTIQSLTGGGGGTLVQYAQSQEGGQQFFVPVEWAMSARCVAVTVAELSGCQIRTAGGGGNSATSSPLLTSPGGGSAIPEETSRKREIRLLKNRSLLKTRTIKCTLCNGEFSLDFPHYMFYSTAMEEEREILRQETGYNSNLPYCSTWGKMPVAPIELVSNQAGLLCREAAKECRRKKKEYIKCLENRVAVLENQNKALIDELKSLKELYCRKE